MDVSLARLRLLPGFRADGFVHLRLPAIARPDRASGRRTAPRALPLSAVLGRRRAHHLFRCPGFQRVGRRRRPRSLLGEARHARYRRGQVRHPSTALPTLAAVRPERAILCRRYVATADERLAADDGSRRALALVLRAARRPSSAPRLRLARLDYSLDGLRGRRLRLPEPAFVRDDSWLPDPL